MKTTILRILEGEYLQSAVLSLLHFIFFRSFIILYTIFIYIRYIFGRMSLTKYVF